jgi:hypothetical protein
MNIDHRLNDPLFAPTPPTGAQPRQDNDKLERVAPAAETDAFAGQDQRRERGKDEVALYDARGQKTGPDNATTKAAEEQAGQPEDDPQTAEAQARPSKPSGEPMSEQEVLELNDLKLRDQEVRTHEQQHAAVGGQHTGAPSYDYQTGPDGKQYAVGGEVQVDLSPIPGDPRATIDKMRQVKAAALAPAEPSQADRNAAARADQHIREAQSELRNPDPEQATTAGPAKAEPDTGQPQQDSQMALRNQVIAGVYGKSAQVQSQSLLSLA